MEIIKNKRCPRCDVKIPNALMRCPSCDLDFSKFEHASNGEAKEMIKNGESDQVLMRKGRPFDVPFLKLFLLTVFLGFTGAHYYYVGRYKMGIFYSIFCFVGVLNAILTSVFHLNMHGGLWEIFTILVLTWGAVILLWLIDIIKVCLNKFKIPVGRRS